MKIIVANALWPILALSDIANFEKSIKRVWALSPFIFISKVLRHYQNYLKLGFSILGLLEFNSSICFSSSFLTVYYVKVLLS